MIIGAADLLKRRGMHATSIREVVRHSETPRGSITHHFPGGKKELLEAAIKYAGEEVSGPLTQLLAAHSPIKGLELFVGAWRKTLIDTSFDAGCAVLAVTVEQYTSDQRSEADQVLERQIHQQLLSQAHKIFCGWQRLISESLHNSGIDSARADSLALMTIAAIEGRLHCAGRRAALYRWIGFGSRCATCSSTRWFRWKMPQAVQTHAESPHR